MRPENLAVTKILANTHQVTWVFQIGQLIIFKVPKPMEQFCAIIDGSCKMSHNSVP